MILPTEVKIQRATKYAVHTQNSYEVSNLSCDVNIIKLCSITCLASFKIFIECCDISYFTTTADIRLHYPKP